MNEVLNHVLKQANIGNYVEFEATPPIPEAQLLTLIKQLSDILPPWTIVQREIEGRGSSTYISTPISPDLEGIMRLIAKGYDLSTSQ